MMKRFRSNTAAKDDGLADRGPLNPLDPLSAPTTRSQHSQASLLGPQISLNAHLTRHRLSTEHQTQSSQHSQQSQDSASNLSSTGPITRRSSSNHRAQNPHQSTSPHGKKNDPHNTASSITDFNIIAHFPQTRSPLPKQAQKRTRALVGLDTDLELSDDSSSIPPPPPQPKPPRFSRSSTSKTTDHIDSYPLNHHSSAILTTSSSPSSSHLPPSHKSHLHRPASSGSMSIHDTDLSSPLLSTTSPKLLSSSTSQYHLDPLALNPSLQIHNHVHTHPNRPIDSRPTKPSKSQRPPITYLTPKLTARRPDEPNSLTHVTFRLSTSSKYGNLPNVAVNTRSSRRHSGEPFHNDNSLFTGPQDDNDVSSWCSEEEERFWASSTIFSDHSDNDDWSDSSDSEETIPQARRRGRPPGPSKGPKPKPPKDQSILAMSSRTPRIQGKLVRSGGSYSQHPSPISSPSLHSDCSEFDLRSDDDGNLIDINDPWVSSVTDIFSFKFPSTLTEFSAHKGHIPATYLHQIFTEGTFIYGYRGLSIEVNINPTTYHVYIVVGYRSSMNDKNLTYRGRGPRVVVDHLTNEEWLTQKRNHTLCEYTYTTDGEIEILGLDQHTLHQLRALKSTDGSSNSNLPLLVVGEIIAHEPTVGGKTTGKGKKSKTAPQFQPVGNSSVEKASIAVETLKTRQQRKQQLQEKELAKKKETIRTIRANKAAAAAAVGTVQPVPIATTTTTTTTTMNENSNNLSTGSESLDIPQLKESLSDAQWKRLETLHDQFERNKSAVVKSSDQLFDELTASKANNPNNIYTQHHLVRQLLPHELEDNTSITSRALLDPAIFQSNLLTGVTTFSGAGRDLQQELTGTYCSKRVKLHGAVLNQLGDISLDDEARLRHFSIQDMPSLDAIYYAVARHFPPQSLCTSQQEFVGTFDEVASFQPPGKWIGQYQVPTMNIQSSRQEVTYHLYLGNLGDPAINDFHQRIQPLLLHYIDTASYIDSRDHIWEVLFAFQKTAIINKQQAHKEPLVTWKLVGFTTLYTFHKHPSSHRLRLSQILVLPYAQRAGHGMKILEAVYNLARDRNSFEVNIEDPSVGMQMLRDCCDVKRALELGYFQHSIAYQLNVAGIDECESQSSRSNSNALIPTCTIANNSASNSSSSTLAASFKARNSISAAGSGTSTHGWNAPNMRQPKWGKVGADGCCVWTAKQIEDARATLSITKLQCERVMECLCLAQIDPGNEDHLREFRLRVKRRLMQSQKNSLEGLSVEDRKKVLQQLFDEEYQQYLTVHRKLRIKS